MEFSPREQPSCTKRGALLDAAAPAGGVRIRAFMGINNCFRGDLRVSSDEHPFCASDTSPFAKCVPTRKTLSPLPLPPGVGVGSLPQGWRLTLVPAAREEPSHAQNPGHGPPNAATVAASNLGECHQGACVCHPELWRESNYRGPASARSDALRLLQKWEGRPPPSSLKVFYIQHLAGQRTSRSGDCDHLSRLYWQSL